MSIKHDLRQLLKPYYWFNILLSISYLTCKRLNLFCNYLFPGSDCDLDSRETEIMFFLIIVIMLRTRKTGSVSMVSYLSSSFVYTKIANLILWFYADIRYGLIFGAIVILCSLLLPEPTYNGPENVIYFRGPASLEEELSRHRGTTWLVCAYAAWHPACVTFAPIYADISHSYGLNNLKFGKIDVGRYPEVAAKYRIQDGPSSRQLPTVLLMKNGEEVMRRPQPDRTGKLQKFLFSKENMKSAFDLDILYKECKQKLSEKETKKSK